MLRDIVIPEVHYEDEVHNVFLNEPVVKIGSYFQLVIKEERPEVSDKRHMSGFSGIGGAEEVWLLGNVLC